MSCIFVCGRCRGCEPPAAGTRQVPPCCRHKAVAVQSTRCKIAARRPLQSLTKAGGWWLGPECGNTAVSRAHTSQLNMGPPYICCSSAPTSAGPRGQWRPLSAQPFVAESLSSQNLKYFIRPPRLHSLFFHDYFKEHRRGLLPLTPSATVTP